MPRNKTTVPEVDDREKGQRALELPLWIDRHVPAMQNPEWLYAETWRQIVQNQPFAVICRDALINQAASLDWMVVPRDSRQRDSLKPQIDYYTKFFQNNGEYDYLDTIHWVCKDMLDIPFGGAAEVGRAGDEPEGKVLWLRPLDGGTLFPYPNSYYPVGQMLREDMTRYVFFPYYAIDRMCMSPRTEIRYKGWGMPPPVKVYLTFEALARGDRYYANLLLDSPQVGILDLMDMEKETAEQWVMSWRNTLTGIDPFKIPVLYQHTSPAQFISFTRNPTELMFDKALLRYESIMAAGYGIGLSDVGISPTSSGGETLAGSIRQERKSRRNGISVLKRKIKSFFDFMLPDTLEFILVDLDDEVSVALGRARLSSATAFGLMVDKGVLEAAEVRQQLIADGLVSISIPDEPPPPPVQAVPPSNAKRPGMLGNPVPPSGGGHGEVRQSYASESIHKLFELSDLQIQRLAVSVISIMADAESMYGRANAMDVDRNIVKTSIDWQYALDIKGVAEDFIVAYESNVTKMIQGKADLDYVSGIANSPIIDIPKNKLGLRKYKNKITKDLEALLAWMPDAVSFSVINGLSAYANEFGYDRELDSGAILVDNRAISSIRNELMELENGVMEELYKSIIVQSNTILEDISNGRSSEKSEP